MTMENKTIREIITEHQNEILKGNLAPGRASEILLELSAIIGNCNDEIRIRDIEYNKILLKYYEQEVTANRAKIKAETTAEYEAKRIARDTKDLVVEMCRSLKYFLKAAEEEYQMGRFQK
jgi:hypothetical protein